MSDLDEMKVACGRSHTERAMVVHRAPRPILQSHHGPCDENEGGIGRDREGGQGGMKGGMKGGMQRVHVCVSQGRRGAGQTSQLHSPIVSWHLRESGLSLGVLALRPLGP